MGRKSKLSPAQWDEVAKRLAAGEGKAELAKEYGVHVSQIARNVSQITQAVQNVAQQIVDTEQAIKALPINQQILAFDHAAKLKSMLENVSAGAALGAATFHRLTSIANGQAAMVDDASPETSVQQLQMVAALTDTANKALAPALGLINAHKDVVAKLHEAKPQRQKLDASKVSDKALAELLTARG